MKTLLVAALIFSNSAYAGLLNTVKSAITPGTKAAVKEADQAVLKSTEETMSSFLKLKSDARTLARDLKTKQSKSMYIVSENGVYIKLNVHAFPDRTTQVVIETNKRGPELWEIRKDFKTFPEFKVQNPATYTFPKDGEDARGVVEDITAFVQRVNNGAYGIKAAPTSTVRSRKQVPAANTSK